MKIINQEIRMHDIMFEVEFANNEFRLSELKKYISETFKVDYTKIQCDYFQIIDNHVFVYFNKYTN